MINKEPLFDIERARQTIEKGRRSRWWIRKGTMKSGFHYVDASGNRITDPAQLERIRSLVIPPAWRYVRISPSHSSSLQVVGMDTTGRVQYRYHPKFCERQQIKKFSRIVTFGTYLPKLRAVTNEHIQLSGFPRERVLAVMLRLINSLYFRVGTEKSAKHYRTFGITTFQNRHLEIKRGGHLIFEFVGKSHVQHRKILVDAELASIMRKLKEIGAKRKLFHYVDEAGKYRPVRPSDINSYLKQATAPEFSAKDLRTWGGSMLAAMELAELGPAETPEQTKKNIVKAVKSVAQQLGNTPTVCRGSYIHPGVLAAYEKGRTIEHFLPRKARMIRGVETEGELQEKALLRLLSEQI